MFDFYDPLYDLDRDGKLDRFEQQTMFEDDFVGMQMTARSRREAIELTGDDTFYCGPDEDEDI